MSAKSTEDILRQWKEIIHMAWHLADDSEHGVDYGWQRLYEALDKYQINPDADIHPQINDDLDRLLKAMKRR